MFYIATNNGFCADFSAINTDIKSAVFKPDIRLAIPFATFEKADGFAKMLISRGKIKYFCVVSSGS